MMIARRTACSLGTAWCLLAVAGPPPAVAGEAAPDPIASIQRLDQLVSPVHVTHAPGDATRLFICEQIGRIRIYDRATGLLVPRPFLDIGHITRGIGEGGLLSVAFHPNWAVNGKIYVAYNRQPDDDMMIAEFTITADPDLVDPASQVVLKTLADYAGHHGGQLLFGPDDMLYFSSGDGTGNASNDAPNNAQNLLSLHGKILRLDVDNPPTYVPAGNPYVGNPAAFDEVWSRGLRNPWRFSFDRGTGDLWIADVGKETWEEIDYQPVSSTGTHNYGWRCMEGIVCTPYGGCTCFDPTQTLPVHVVAQGDAGTCAIIGGFVYRGPALPSLQGRYFYSDFCGGYLRSFAFTPDGMGSVTVSDHVDHSAEFNPGGGLLFPTSFGEDTEGELYLTGREGFLWQLVPLAAADCNTNGVVDSQDIALGTSLDCNGNGLPDECDIASGASTDCNGNTTPDDCEFGAPVALGSPTLAPIGTGSPQSHTFVAPPPARGRVTITVTATADLEATHEWIDVRINGALAGTVFQMGAPFCAPVVRSFELAPEVFNALVAGGDAVVDLEGSVNVNPVQCAGSQVSVTLDYQTLDAAADLDGSGAADVCECLADADGSGAVDVSDLLDVLAVWGPCPGCPEDVTFDGQVDVSDLLAVLAAWGACP